MPSPGIPDEDHDIPQEEELENSFHEEQFNPTEIDGLRHQFGGREKRVLNAEDPDQIV